MLDGYLGRGPTEGTYRGDQQRGPPEGTYLESTEGRYLPAYLESTEVTYHLSLEGRARVLPSWSRSIDPFDFCQYSLDLLHQITNITRSDTSTQKKFSGSSSQGISSKAVAHVYGFGTLMG